MIDRIPLRKIPWYIYACYGLGVLAFLGYVFTRQLWMLVIAVLISSSAAYLVRANVKSWGDQQRDRS